MPSKSKALAGIWLNSNLKVLEAKIRQLDIETSLLNKPPRIIEEEDSWYDQDVNSAYVAKLGRRNAMVEQSDGIVKEQQAQIEALEAALSSYDTEDGPDARIAMFRRACLKMLDTTKLHAPAHEQDVVPESQIDQSGAVELANSVPLSLPTEEVARARMLTVLNGIDNASRERGVFTAHQIYALLATCRDQADQERTASDKMKTALRERVQTLEDSVLQMEGGRKVLREQMDKLQMKLDDKREEHNLELESLRHIHHVQLESSEDAAIGMAEEAVAQRELELRAILVSVEEFQATTEELDLVREEKRIRYHELQDARSKIRELEAKEAARDDLDEAERLRIEKITELCEGNDKLVKQVRELEDAKRLSDQELHTLRTQSTADKEQLDIAADDLQDLKLKSDQAKYNSDQQLEEALGKLNTARTEVEVGTRNHQELQRTLQHVQNHYAGGLVSVVIALAEAVRRCKGLQVIVRSKDASIVSARGEIGGLWIENDAALQKIQESRATTRQLHNDWATGMTSTVIALAESWKCLNRLRLRVRNRDASIGYLEQQSGDKDAHLLTATNEIADLRTRLSNGDAALQLEQEQSDQLNERLAAKETTLVSARFEVQTLEDDRQSKRDTIDGLCALLEWYVSPVNCDMKTKRILSLANSLLDEHPECQVLELDEAALNWDIAMMGDCDGEISAGSHHNRLRKLWVESCRGHPSWPAIMTAIENFIDSGNRVHSHNWSPQMFAAISNNVVQQLVESERRSTFACLAALRTIECELRFLSEIDVDRLLDLHQQIATCLAGLPNCEFLQVISNWMSQVLLRQPVQDIRTAIDYVSGANLREDAADHIPRCMIRSGNFLVVISPRSIVLNVYRARDMRPEGDINMTMVFLQPRRNRDGIAVEEDFLFDLTSPSQIQWYWRRFVPLLNDAERGNWGDEREVPGPPAA